MQPIIVEENGLIKIKGGILQDGTPTPETPVNIDIPTGNTSVLVNGRNLSLSLGNIELGAISTYEDYIYPSGDKWYLKKRIGKVVLDGSESWQYISVTQGSLFRNNNIITNDINDNTYIPYSNNYKGIAYNTYLNRANNQFYIQSQNDLLDIIDNRYTSASDFKTWLSTHNTIVYYVLKTETDTEITDTTLISQLNIIRDTFRGSYLLTPGINLDNRTIYLNIPTGTTISEEKIIAQTDNADNYIAEDSTGGYYHYNDTDYVFYDSNTNLPSVQLPEDFGTIIEVDEESVLYSYISRKSHEKVYVHSEDFAKKESLSKEDIITEVEEKVRGYGVPINSVIGFDGIEADIPGGYEVSEENLVTLDDINDLNTYSTNEKKVGTWIDGKPIYRKVINITTTSGTTQILKSEISNELDTIIKIGGTTIQPDGNIVTLEYYYGSNDYCSIYYSPSYGKLYIRCGSSYGFGDSRIIIEYTKTTD